MTGKRQDRKRHWLFRVEDGDVEHYVDCDGGTRNGDNYFDGTEAQARLEAERRANLYEGDPRNGTVLKVTYESHGIVAEEERCRK